MWMVWFGLGVEEALPATPRIGISKEKPERKQLLLATVVMVGVSATR